MVKSIPLGLDQEFEIVEPEEERLYWGVYVKRGSIPKHVLESPDKATRIFLTEAEARLKVLQSGREIISVESGSLAFWIEKSRKEGMKIVMLVTLLDGAWSVACKWKVSQ